MPAAKELPFSHHLKKFKKSLSAKRDASVPRLVLLIMGNTHDKTLSRECKKDMNAIRTVFKNACNHFNLDFKTIDVAGKHYRWDNLDKAIDCIHTDQDFNAVNADDIVVFYYTGHGFSYDKDRYTRYPQLDMRPHNKQVHYNNINFIKDNTLNLEAVLNIIRFKGKRVNIAIADCCNTTIPYKRPKANLHDMWVSGQILPAKKSKLTKRSYTDDNTEVSILVGSSQFGQPAVTDSKMGSLFTHFFAKAFNALLTGKHRGEAYIPWVKILKKVAAQALKESKGYDVGGGVAGKQKAVFQVYAGQGI